jgi:hypothetical protein
MKPRYISELTDILKVPFPMDKRKRECLAGFILAVIQVRTVNLAELALCITGNAKPSSAYRRLQRLLSTLPLCSAQLGCWLLGWFYDEDDQFYLSMDRSNWRWGKININFLVIGVPYKRMAIPLLWVMLPKQGNSNTDERIALLKELFRFLPSHRVKGLLGDREFVGKRWFEWLEKREIAFYIRVKQNYLTTTCNGQETTVEALFYHLAPGEKQALKTKRSLFGRRVYLTGSRLESGELMVIASLHADTCAITAYLERWEIETLFENLKSRGFDFESTHITDTGKLERLMGVLAIAACWAYRSGMWRIDEGELIRVKKHGRPAVSLFRHGLDALRSLLLQPTTWRAWKPLIHLWRELKTCLPQPLAAL